MDTRYDSAIIGSGPAGLSAAINLKVRNKNIIVFGTENLSSKLMKAPNINNYLGFYGITGIELQEKFKGHINSMGIKIKPEAVTSVYSMGDYFTIACKNGMYESKTVIISTGVEFSKPFLGEEKFLGRGVGYCATCDAPLYRGKTVTIIGYNNDAEKEADYVSEIVDKVYYIPMYKGECNLNPNIEVISDIPTEIRGKDSVSRLMMKNGSIITDGVFILKDSIPFGQLVPGIEVEDGHIKVNRNMETNISGCFAAGDCTGKPYQYMKSAGEGQVAALTAVKYIDSLK